MAPQINPIQRGFVYGRQFTLNIVELDTVSRMFSNMPQLMMPILMLFDFESAFPSILHHWIDCVLRHGNFLDGFTCQNDLPLQLSFHMSRWKGSIPPLVSQWSAPGLSTEWPHLQHRFGSLPEEDCPGGELATGWHLESLCR